MEIDFNKQSRGKGKDWSKRCLSFSFLSAPLVMNSFKNDYRQMENPAKDKKRIENSRYIAKVLMKEVGKAGKLHKSRKDNDRKGLK